MVMGIVVGGLLMVLYLPIINLASAASSGNLGG
jgi:type II secretory pathway component PulF